jgi:hypothetical protein
MNKQPMRFIVFLLFLAMLFFAFEAMSSATKPDWAFSSWSVKADSSLVPHSPEKIAVTMTNGTTATFTILGNVSASQFSHFKITPNQPSGSTAISFTLTGKNGTVGSLNMVIPQSAVPYGTTPVVYVDGQHSSIQGYALEAGGFQVWFTLEFSSHAVVIEFETTGVTPSLFPSPSSTATASPTSSAEPTPTVIPTDSPIVNSPTPSPTPQQSQFFVEVAGMTVTSVALMLAVTFAVMRYRHKHR